MDPLKILWVCIAMNIFCIGLNINSFIEYKHKLNVIESFGQRDNGLIGSPPC